MAMGTLVKSLQNIMRNDAGVNGDAQRIEQMTWLFFLKIYDAKEEEWELVDDSYYSVIPERLRWHSWAVDHLCPSLTFPQMSLSNSRSSKRPLPTPITT